MDVSAFHSLALAATRFELRKLSVGHHSSGLAPVTLPPINAARILTVIAVLAAVAPALAAFRAGIASATSRLTAAAGERRRRPRASDRGRRVN